ncbi:MAG: NAD-dependent epimerase/dehydratase family protein [Bacteroidota bacterium]
MSRDIYKDRVLVIGASGQIGTELTVALRHFYGAANVIAADLRVPPEIADGLNVPLDVTDLRALRTLVRDRRVTGIYHLAAVLSAKGEERPLETWGRNMTGLLHVLEVAREQKCRVFWPSSIAVFDRQGQLMPSTVYGMSKLAGEHWCSYYHQRYGVDVRSLRFPGLISYSAPAGGGTTDYAVDIFYHQHYTCFLKEDTALPMLYMPDAIRAVMTLMQAPAKNLTQRVYDLAGLSFTPAELAAAIRKFKPGFTISYAPDDRQAIADNWPSVVDDGQARRDWQWGHRYNLDAIVQDMLKHIHQESYAGNV